MLPLKINCVVTGALETNCYIVQNEPSKAAFVIDPGDASEELAEAVHGLQVEDILLTHSHFDHIGGVAWLVGLTSARLWIHEAESGWLTDARRNLSGLFMESGAIITAPAATNIMKGDTTLQLLGTEIAAFHTPGHTPGHMIYSLGKTLFTGDLVFQGATGRTDFPGGSHTTLLNSLRRVILPLPDEVRILPGHGLASTLLCERYYLTQLCQEG